jgi:hypothetical protein
LFLKALIGKGPIPRRLPSGEMPRIFQWIFFLESLDGNSSAKHGLIERKYGGPGCPMAEM